MKIDKTSRVMLSVKVSSSIVLAAVLLFLANNTTNGRVVEDPIIPNRSTPDTLIQEEEPVGTVTTTMDDLISAMIMVESRGNDSAYCAREDAAGCLQIRPVMVAEVNRILKREAYTLQDRWNRQKSVEMLRVFSKYYKLESFEDIARCWNGGPRGNTYASTNRYWNKVQNEMI